MWREHSRVGREGPRLALINGVAGAVWAPGGHMRAAFTFTVEHGKITAIEILSEPERIGQLEVTILGE